jgi:Zn-dependent protease with chaperone function
MASTSQTSDSPLAPSLRAGLAAIKQGNPETAIAHLEQIAAKSQTPARLLQAQMGLVVAYEQTGQVPQAIELCQTLSHSPDDRVREWAAKIRTQFQQRHPQHFPSPAQPTPTGFVPFDATPKPTGFQPFTDKPTDQRSADPVPFPESAGFVPFSDDRAPSSNPPNSNPSNPNSDSPNAGAGTTATQPSAPQGSPFPSTAAQPVQPAPSSPTRSLPPAQPWRNSGRASQWKSLKPPKLIELHLIQLGSFLLLFALCVALLLIFMNVTNQALVFFPWTEPIQAFYFTKPTRPLLLMFILLWAAAPWLLDVLLNAGYGMRSLSMTKLAAISPETPKVLRQICRQHKWTLPKLAILPDSTPAIFSYGNLPQTTRIVVSQGLLDRLEDGEIATLYAAEMAHLHYGDMGLMSAFVLLAQLPYTLYWQVSGLGDWLQVKARSFKSPAQKSPASKSSAQKSIKIEDYQHYLVYLWWAGVGVTALWSAIAYGLYWLWRWPMLALSRMRLIYSDRFAVDVTGNPNALTRALLKVTVGVADAIDRQGGTSYFLEGFELLMPVAHRHAAVLGRLCDRFASANVLVWEINHPQRQWLVVNNSHPLLGERLLWLTRCAQFWKLECELDLAAAVGKVKAPISSGLWLQGAPFFGSAIGLSAGVSVALAGWVGKAFDVRAIEWVFFDRGWLIGGLMLVGFSIGTLLRINSFFPDIKPYTFAAVPDLSELAIDSAMSPLDSKAVRLSGKLLGRSGMGNWLGQDLLLQTDTSLVKLHCFSRLGPLGNFLPESVRPSDWIGQEVIVTGWFRRGATPWLDVDTFRCGKIQTPANGHPVWSTMLVLLTAIWGAYVLARGGL